MMEQLNREVMNWCETCERELYEDDEYTTCEESGCAECASCERERIASGDAKVIWLT